MFIMEERGLENGDWSSRLMGTGDNKPLSKKVRRKNTLPYSQHVDAPLASDKIYNIETASPIYHVHFLKSFEQH